MGRLWVCHRHTNVGKDMGVVMELQEKASKGRPISGKSSFSCIASLQLNHHLILPQFILHIACMMQEAKQQLTKET
jgi:hypothetical protein